MERNEYGAEVERESERKEEYGRERNGYGAEVERESEKRDRSDGKVGRMREQEDTR